MVNIDGLEVFTHFDFEQASKVSGLYFTKCT